MSNIAASSDKYSGFQARLNQFAQAQKTGTAADTKQAEAKKADSSGLVGMLSKLTGIDEKTLNGIVGVAQSISNGDVMNALQGLAGLAGLEGNVSDIFNNMDHPLEAAEAAIDMLGLEDTAAGEVISGINDLSGAWGSIKDVPSDLISAISNGNFKDIPGLLGNVSNAWTQASQGASLIGNGIDKVTSFFGGNTNIGGWVDGAIQTVNDFVGGKGDLGNIFSTVGDWVGGLFGGGKTDGATASGGKTSGLGGIADWIGGAVETVSDWFTGGDDAAAEGAEESGSWLDGIGDFVGGIFSGGDEGAEESGSWLGGVVDTVGGWIGGLFD